MRDGLFWVIIGAAATPLYAWKECLKASCAIAIIALSARWLIGSHETAASACMVVGCSLVSGFGVVSLGGGLLLLLGMMSAK